MVKVLEVQKYKSLQENFHMVWTEFIATSFVKKVLEIVAINDN